jgi:hypothetical protein
MCCLFVLFMCVVYAFFSLSQQGVSRSCEQIMCSGAIICRGII